MINKDSWKISEIECTPCDPETDSKCKKLQDPIQCPTGYTLDSEDNSCKKCEDTNCLSCKNGVDICDACSKYFFLKEDSCLPCHSSCETCTGESENDCILCVQAFENSKFDSELPSTNQTCS